MPPQSGDLVACVGTRRLRRVPRAQSGAVALPAGGGHPQYPVSTVGPCQGVGPCSGAVASAPALCLCSWALQLL